MGTPIFLYQIRDKETGRYSAGGNPPRWSKTKGKFWRIDDLCRHFYLIDTSKKDPYENAEVIIYECTCVKTTKISQTKYYLNDK